MGQIWTSAATSSRILLRPRRALLGALLFLAMAVGQTWMRGAGSLGGFGPLHGVSTAAEVLVRLLPVFSCVIASAWVGAICSKEHTTELHLMGITRSQVAISAIVAVTLVSTALALAAVGLSAAAGAWLAQPPTTLPGGQTIDTPSGFHWRVALLPLVAILWTCLGAGVGVASRSAVFSIAGVLAMYASGFALERLSLIQPAMLGALAWHPNGVTSSLITGTSVPLYPASATTVPQTVAALSTWAALTAWLLVGAHRSHGQRVDRLNAAKHGFGWAAVGVALVVVGYVVPSKLSESIPWEYKLEWRTMVAEENTPADELERLILDDKRRATYSADLDRESLSALRALVRDVRGREGPPVATDDLQAKGPGSVVVNLGPDKIGADGTVSPAPQFGACLTWQSGRWMLQAVSSSGVTCVD